MEILLLLLLVGGGVLAYRRFSADHSGPELAWSGAPAPHPAKDEGQEPYRSDAPVPPIRTAVALSRIETRRLLASPLLWVGVTLTGLASLASRQAASPCAAERR